MTEERKMLKERFGVSYLRPYQELTIAHIMEARNKGTGRILCCLPTGSGKSLCFMYPIAVLKKRCILIYPLLSLMNDQAMRFSRAGIPFFVLRGGMEWEDRQKTLEGIRRDSSAAVITNPEMLLAMARRGELSAFGETELLVIDEAHTAVTWGDSFRPSYSSLPDLIEAINPHSVLAFTATMDERIERGIIRRIFSGKQPRIVRGSSDRENIFYHAIRSLSKIHDAARILTPLSSRPAVIFCRSRFLAEETARRLEPCFDIRPYHAGLKKSRKNELERWFLGSGSGVLSATSAYGLGVDKGNIRTVIHLSLPSSAADFLQESGRGGRDGKRMDSYVLYGQDEHTEVESIFTSGHCIRTGLLNAMGEEPESDHCLSCSSCMDDGYIRAGEEEIIKWVRFHPFSKPESLAECLSSPSVFSKHHLSGWSKEEITAASDILCEEKQIRKIWGRLFVF